MSEENNEHSQEENPQDKAEAAGKGGLSRTSGPPLSGPDPLDPSPPVDSITPPPVLPKASDAPIAMGFSDRNWAMITHLSPLLGYFTGIGFIAPLVIWLLMRERSSFMDDQGKESLNFNITVLITMLVVGVLGMFTCGIGAFLALPVSIAHIGFSIYAGVQANNGRAYRYPWILRLVK